MVLESGQRLVYEDRVRVPRLYVQWPTVGEKHDDRFALDLLGTILTGPRTARLTKALVYDRQAAATVSAVQSSNADGGEFVVTITPRPGHALTDLEAAADAIIEKLKKEAACQELVASVRQAGRVRRGTLRASRTRVVRPADIKAVRATLGASESEFALMIGVSVATRRNWEQGRRTPDGPALALLRVAEKNPEAVANALHGVGEHAIGAAPDDLEGARRKRKR